MLSARIRSMHGAPQVVPLAWFPANGLSALCWAELFHPPSRSRRSPGRVQVVNSICTFALVELGSGHAFSLSISRPADEVREGLYLLLHQGILCEIASAPVIGRRLGG
jgi:hypothetical protein